MIVQVIPLAYFLQKINEWFPPFSQGVSSSAEGGGILTAFASGGVLLLHVLTALLAVMIFLRCARSLLAGKSDAEQWGFFSLPNGAKLPLAHWENIVGRAGSCDVVLNFPTVSRQHAAVQRDKDGLWTVFPLSARGGVAVNGKTEIGRAHV